MRVFLCFGLALGGFKRPADQVTIGLTDWSFRMSINTSCLVGWGL